MDVVCGAALVGEPVALAVPLEEAEELVAVGVKSVMSSVPQTYVAMQFFSASAGLGPLDVVSTQMPSARSQMLVGMVDL